MISWSSSTASSTPATSLKPIFGESGAIRFARDLPKLITFDPPPCTWFIRKIQNPIRSRNGRNDPSRAIHEKPPVPFESHFTSCCLEQRLEAHLRLVGRVVDGLLLVVLEKDEVDRAMRRIERRLLDLVRLDGGDRFGGRELPARMTLRDQRLTREPHEDDDHDEREERAAEETVHVGLPLRVAE